ncbi:peptidoglycan DD-metalloendopeptidase family protein [Patescibacteria group bacterium]|nr:peptidoglycan DD-metalloendopeptidase family protein [Patescibacteria group bacterium]
MNQKKFFFLGTIILCFFLARTPFRAHADMIGDLKNQIDQKNAEIKKLEEEGQKYGDVIAVKEKEIGTLQQRINALGRNIKKLDSDVKITNAKVKKTELEIQQLNAQIQEKELSIENKKAALALLLESIHQRDQENMIEILLKNPSLSSFFNEINATNILQKQIADDERELAELKNGLLEDKQNAEDKKTNLTGLRSVLQDKKILQQNEKNARTQLLADTKNQEKLYQQKLSDTQKRQQEIAKEIETLEEKLRLLVDPNSLPHPSAIFIVPASGRLTQGYGRTAFAMNSDFYRFHNGIDIANGYGTPIVAAGNGKVIAVGNSDRYCPGGTYGQYIVIKHENNLATLYGHLSLIKVTPGQNVAQGDLIGYMGHSGLATGNHLHFTVYDSRTLEIKQSRVCGLLPYGGSVNPLNYLPAF